MNPEERSQNRRTELKAILAETLSIDAESIDSSRRFADYPNIDSIAMLRFMVAVESKIGFSFDMAELDAAFDSIDSLDAFLTSKAQSRPYGR